ncbi:M23 family metallopeptidase [Rhodococcus sp. 1168]|uniref:M23 family metallopeptidase n=1 Tax=Rhodococcus sp. 1168 TaxID=2018041 RepID=UPI000A0D1CAD|nr:M23 family metallopeptidase [Rhodococcus sp. 1168]ORI18353.1 peptidase [Rhodococcus sp. 1168]
MKALAAALVAALISAAGGLAEGSLAGASPQTASQAFHWPLSPRPTVVTVFDPPEHDWLPGHRGVDLAGSSSQAVRAAGPGTVVFAGRVAGKPVVSIDHPGGLRTTYEPVTASVHAGMRVRASEVVGTLEPGHPSCTDTCLHWGVRRGREYLDPLALVHFTPIRLKPLHAK